MVQKTERMTWTTALGVQKGDFSLDLKKVKI